MTINAETAAAIKDALDKTSLRAIAAFRRNIDTQGHNLTGRLKNSFRYETRATGSGLQSKIYSENYGGIVDQGVKASRIPFSGRRGRGGKSKYIEGLKDYFIRRGRGASEALRAAFATAMVHRREGMPTRASYRFSRNGRRTNFITAEIPAIEKDLRATVEKDVAQALEVSVATRFRQIL